MFATPGNTTIEQIHIFFRNYLRKNHFRYVSHEEIDDMLHRAQMTVFMQRYGNPQEYAPGRPIAPVSYSLTQKIKDDVRAFITEPKVIKLDSKGEYDLSTFDGNTDEIADATVFKGGSGYTAGSLVVDDTGTNGTGFAGTYTVDSNGTITSITITNNGSGYTRAPSLAGDAGGSGAELFALRRGQYEHMTSVRTHYFDDQFSRVKKRGIEIVNDEDVTSRIESHLIPPQTERPIAIFYTNILRVIPSLVDFVEIQYLRLPNKPKFAYTVVSGRNVTYDSANSVDLEWSEPVINEIIFRAMNFLGVPMKSDRLLQSTAMNLNEGV